jgi:hypothetical protein
MSDEVEVSRVARRRLRRDIATNRDDQNDETNNDLSSPVNRTSTGPRVSLFKSFIIIYFLIMMFIM